MYTLVKSVADTIETEMYDAGSIYVMEYNLQSQRRELIVDMETFEGTICCKCAKPVTSCLKGSGCKERLASAEENVPVSPPATDLPTPKWSDEELDTSGDDLVRDSIQKVTSWLKNQYGDGRQNPNLDGKKTSETPWTTGGEWNDGSQSVDGPLPELTAANLGDTGRESSISYPESSQQSGSIDVQVLFNKFDLSEPVNKNNLALLNYYRAPKVELPKKQLPVSRNQVAYERSKVVPGLYGIQSGVLKYPLNYVDLTLTPLLPVAGSPMNPLPAYAPTSILNVSNVQPYISGYNAGCYTYF